MDSPTLYSTPTADPDLALFAQIAAGSEQAFGVIFHRYRLKVYHFSRNLVEVDSLAEEIVQDVFLKLWLNRDSLKEVANPGNYLFVMAKNRSLDQLSRLATERKFRRQLGMPEDSPVSGSEERLWYRESLASVQEAVGQLPEQQRRVFQLSKLDGLSRQEIATQLGISPNTVRNHLSAAVKAVQDYLISHGKIVTVLLFLQFLGRH